MDWGDIKPWLAKLAPMLGTALGGPLGAAAGALVSSALGAKDTSPQSVADAIKTGALTGEQIAALKKAEQDFQIQMTALNLGSVEKLAELDFKNTQGAREREMVVKDRTPAVGFYLLTLGFYGLLAFFCASAMNPNLKPNAEVMDILKIMIGSLGTAWVGAVNYYYGTTQGSRDKDVMLHQSTPVDGGK